MSAKITSVAEGLLAAKALEEAGVRHCYMPCNACVQGEDLLKFATPSSVLEAWCGPVRWKKIEGFFETPDAMYLSEDHVLDAGTLGLVMR